MPKTGNAKSKGRGKRGGRRPQYRGDPSDDENMFTNIGALRGFFDLLVQHNSPSRKRRSSAGRGSRRKPSHPEDDNASDCFRCHCSHGCSNKKPPRKTTASKRKTKICSASTSTSANVNLAESDSGEEFDSVVTDTQTDTITKKVDKFFQRFKSDDEDDEDLKPAKPATAPEKKSKEFYTFNSDSEEEPKAAYKIPDETVVTSKPSTSSDVSIGNLVTSGLKLLTSAPAINSDKKVEDLFAYVDEIMKECDEVIDLEADQPKENIPALSLTDLKKKTAEILASVETEAENLKDTFDLESKKPQNSTAEPVTEAPSCPVCLERLGGARQAMSTLCGHMFCELCLSQVIKSTKSCPSCRKKLNKKSMYHPIYI